MTTIICEGGINHNGSVEICKRMIDAAVWAGADIFKLQKRDLETVYGASLDKPRKSPWGTTTRQQKEQLEFSEAEYNEIVSYCKKVGIGFMASAWDTISQDFLKKYDCKWNKIASAMATNLPFIRQVGLEHKPVFLSTGMCTLPEIATAALTLQELGCDVTLMHTVSTYPADETTLNLACIRTLRERFSLPVGYSGHEASVSPSVVAVALGAVAIERHLTLDRAMYGSDQSASLEPMGFYNMVQQIRKIPAMLGTGDKVILPSEIEIAKKLRYWA